MQTLMGIERGISRGEGLISNELEYRFQSYLEWMLQATQRKGIERGEAPFENAYTLSPWKGERAG